MDKIVLGQLAAFVAKVIQGDYSRSEGVERLSESSDIPKDEAEFAESLQFMGVKLEAREMALEQTIKRLQANNAALVEEKQRNQLFSTLFISLFLSISLYVLLMSLARRFSFESEHSPRMVEAIFLFVCIVLIRKSGYPLFSLGVTLKGALASIRLMLPGTFILCAGLLALKGLLLHLDVADLDEEYLVRANFNVLVLVYLPVAMLQEFLSRGVIQTAIASVLDSRGATRWAIITASALFGLVHIQLSVAVAMASFVFSLYWGYLYSRKQCLVGVVLSHFLIGNVAYLLGFWDYLLTL